jgi:hypothetical protein
VSWVPGIDRVEFGIGLWKGDLTLKRKVEALYDTLDREGVLDQQRQAYGLGPEQ